MKRILSVMLAVVMVLGVMCSFSFAAEVPSDAVNTARTSITSCPSCGAYDVTGYTVYVATNDYILEECTHGKTNDIYRRYDVISRCTCGTCGYTFDLDAGDAYRYVGCV